MALNPAPIRVVAALIARDGKYLITQRRSTAVLPLLWEFPGGRVESGESDQAALQRELHERLGVESVVKQLISYVCHHYEHYTIELYLYECALASDAVQTHAVNDARWVSSEDFDDYTFTPADEASMSKLLGVEQ